MRHNNQPIDVEALSETARTELARSIAFERDVAIGNLALLGLPADYEYVPVEPEPTPERAPTPEVVEHRGFSVRH